MDIAFVNTLNGILGFEPTLGCLKHRPRSREQDSALPQHRAPLCRGSPSPSPALQPPPWEHAGKPAVPGRLRHSRFWLSHLAFIAGLETTGSHLSHNKQTLDLLAAPNSSSCASSETAVKSHPWLITYRTYRINSAGGSKLSEAVPWRRFSSGIKERKWIKASTSPQTLFFCSFRPFLFVKQEAGFSPRRDFQ